MSIDLHIAYTRMVAYHSKRLVQMTKAAENSYIIVSNEMTFCSSNVTIGYAKKVPYHFRGNAMVNFKHFNGYFSDISNVERNCAIPL